MGTPTEFQRLENDLDAYRCPVCYGDGEVCNPPEVHKCHSCKGTGVADGMELEIEVVSL